VFRRGNLILSKSAKLKSLRRHFFCPLLSSRYGGLTGQLYAGRTLGTVFPPLSCCHHSLWKKNGGMLTTDQEHTTMNHKFNGAIPCTPKKLAKQLLVESAKILSPIQRQALLDIYKTLDQAEDNIPQDLQAEQQHLACPQNQFYDELNQEYWSGQHYESYSQEYPEDWLRRTQQRPHPKSSNTTY
jgi:hypothetical protein